MTFEQACQLAETIRREGIVLMMAVGYFCKPAEIDDSTHFAISVFASDGFKIIRSENEYRSLPAVAMPKPVMTKSKSIAPTQAALF